jgi:protein arginine N-methyltransferase 1
MVQTHHIFRAHQPLLDDGVRNRAFFAALKKRITPDSVVVDIGSGTGIWAIAAAMAGARKVVAIEKDPLLTAVIDNLAKENRVHDRIEIIRGDSREVRLDREFDVLISETIGNTGFDEQIVPILIDARKRFLKRGGVLIPSSISLVVAAGHLKTRTRRGPAGAPMTCDYFDSLNLNIPVMVSDKSTLRLVSESRELIRVDLTTVKKRPELGNLTARWKLKDVTAINCFVVWAEAILTEGVELSTRETTSWSPIAYKIRPFEKPRGEVEFKLDLSEKSNYWAASLSNNRTRETQSYSPVLASASLSAHVKG